MNFDEFLKLAEKRFSCRAFSDEKVGREKIEKFLRAGIEAPSGRNCQLLQFRVFENPEKIAELSAAISEIKTKSISPIFRPEKFDPIFYAAPAVVFIGAEKNSPDEWKMADACFAAQNIFLAATAENLATVAIGGAKYFENFPEIKSRFFPENFEIQIAFALGFPAENLTAKKPPRKNLQIFWED
jgi:nitroreductase